MSGGCVYYKRLDGTLVPLSQAGPRGPQGPEGRRGPQGIQGQMGPAIKLLGAIGTGTGHVTVAPTATAGDAYTITEVLPWIATLAGAKAGTSVTAPELESGPPVEVGHIIFFDGTAWHNGGKVQGPQGPQGPRGPLSDIRVSTTKGEQPPADPAEGDVFINKADSLTYIAVEDATGTAVWEQVAASGGAWDIVAEWDNVSDATRSFTPDWTKHTLYVLDHFSRDVVKTKSATGLVLTGVQTSHRVGGAAYSADHAANTERQLVPNVWFCRVRFEFDPHAVGMDMHIHTEDSENIVVKASGPSGLTGQFDITWVGAGTGRILALRHP